MIKPGDLIKERGKTRIATENTIKALKVAKYLKLKTRVKHV